MQQLVALAYGIPFDLQAVENTTILAAVASAVLGFVLPTYATTVKAVAVLALSWFVLMNTFGVPVAITLDWFGLSLGFVVGFLLLAVVAHALRRLAVGGWQLLRKS
jgi:hypothetical protein